MRERNPELHRQRVSASLMGNKRRWKGNAAGYVAKHLWIIKHYGKADHCENNPEHKAKRYEWANISGEYLRERSDYKPLCPSCHRIMDKGNYCKNGHEFTKENTYICKQGWRHCRICQNERSKQWRNAQ